MANPFGGFVHTSPLCSSLDHDPAHNLASNAVRDHFGPTVQTVTDCLLSRDLSSSSSGGGGGSGGMSSSTGGSSCTLATILSRIRHECRRDVNETRMGLVKKVDGTINSARGPEAAGYVCDADPIRAALLVLVQHGIVTPLLSKPASSSSTKGGGGAGEGGGGVGGGGRDKHATYRYALDADRARCIVRYPRYVERAKDDVDDNAAAVVEELLVHGRMRTEDAARCAVDSVLRHLVADRDDDDDEDDDDDSEGGTDEDKDREGGSGGGKKAKAGPSSLVDEAEREALRDGVVRSFKRLVELGYVEMVPPLEEEGHAAAAAAAAAANDDAEGGGEFDDGPQQRAGTKRKRGPDDTGGRTTEDGGGDEDDGEEPPPPPGVEPDDPDILALLRKRNYRKTTFPRGAVWRVNPPAFHAAERARCLGRLAEERHGHRIPSAGAVVSAALRFVARRKYSPAAGGSGAGGDPSDDDRANVFSPDDVLPLLPPADLRAAKNQPGGARASVSRTLVALTKVTWPRVASEVEEASGHPRGGVFEMASREMVENLRKRVVFQALVDHQGETAARVCSILEARGYLEAEAIADAAMVPVKDAREVLYRLFRGRYITVLTLQQGKQHNASNAVYLWGVEPSRTMQTVTDNVCRALHNVRLRRQHEMEIGRDWIERAKEAGAVDENEHEIDKANYIKFCSGLERLDDASLKLDETLMVLKDFLLW